MSNRIRSIIGLYKQLNDEEKKELTQRMFIIDPTPYEYVDMKHNQVLIETLEETIYYGNGTFVTKHRGHYEKSGYYNNVFTLDNATTGYGSDAVLFEIDSYNTNKYMDNEEDLDEERYNYEFFGDSHAKLTTIEKVTDFGYKDGFFAVSENYYYLLPLGLHIWKEAVDPFDVDVYKLYEDNKYNERWLFRFTNAHKDI